MPFLTVEWFMHVLPGREIWVSRSMSYSFQFLDIAGQPSPASIHEAGVVRNPWPAAPACRGRGNGLDGVAALQADQHGMRIMLAQRQEHLA